MGPSVSPEDRLISNQVAVCEHRFEGSNPSGPILPSQVSTEQNPYVESQNDAIDAGAPPASSRGIPKGT